MRVDRQLGDLAVECGVTGYLGFEEDFAFVVDDRHGVFGRAAVSGIKLMLLERANLRKAGQKMRDEFEEAVQYFKYGPGRSDPNSIWGWLTAGWDKDHVAVKGMQSAAL